ncbi:MAG: efflux RND transporter periplasmic adaptor subunit [Nitrospiraceae bacterium]
MRPNHAVRAVDHGARTEHEGPSGPRQSRRAEGQQHRSVHSLQDHRRAVPRRRRHAAQYQRRRPGDQRRQSEHPQYRKRLFTIADVHVLRLFVNVPETFSRFHREAGTTADVTVPQLANRHFTAKFLTVARGFDVSTRTAVTVFTIDNEDRALWPGSYAEVHLTAPVDRQVFTIPSTALVFQEHGTQVALVNEDSRVHLQPITVSRLMDNAVEVAGGLSADDRIVNNPSAALLEGDRVRIVTPAPGYDLINLPRSERAQTPAGQASYAP